MAWMTARIRSIVFLVVGTHTHSCSLIVQSIFLHVIKLVASPTPRALVGVFKPAAKGGISNTTKERSPKNPSDRRLEWSIFMSPGLRKNIRFAYVDQEIVCYHRPTGV